RELLRWLGIELFAETHESRWRWRAHRAVHRASLGRLGPDWPEVVDVLRPAWAAGVPPSEVARRLRPVLERRADAHVAGGDGGCSASRTSCTWPGATSEVPSSHPSAGFGCAAPR